MTSIRRGQDEWDGQVETPLGCQVVNWRRAITGRDQVGADVDGRDMTDREPVVVFRTQSTIEANVVRGLLETRGIRGVISSGAPQAIFPFTVGGMGEVRLTVRGEEADKASCLIAEFRQEVSVRLTRIRDEFCSVEKALGYCFSDRGLLEHALTHRSRAHEDVSGGVRDNESLEFLGDAVLGFVISDRLFRECPEWDEGQKSKARSVLVSTSALAMVGAKLGLGEYLLLGRGEEKTGGRQKRSLIADTFEAVVAAIYLDGGIGAAGRFIESCFRDRLEAVRAGGISARLTQDHKSALQEWLQAHDMGLPRYELVATKGPAHSTTFETKVWAGEQAIGCGEGRSKKESEQQAAEAALRALASR
ncbi:MAG: ribonuclease III [Acidobacteriota bacterium]|nr:ribonuclease III [Acidobacteriota bacterium]